MEPLEGVTKQERWLSAQWAHSEREAAPDLRRSMQRRYEGLHLHAALLRRGDYVEACKELQGCVRVAYGRAPKAVQALIYDDILHAFRSLPGMETSQQLAAASGLVQAVEAILPKQRKAAAVSEYKTAAITWHRRLKHPQLQNDSGGEGVGWGSECEQLSADVLVHVFGFLDARSLAIASTICRGWNDAASVDALWRAQFWALFGASHTDMKTAGDKEVCIVRGRGPKTGGQISHPQGDSAAGIWRKAFDLARQGRPSCLFMSNRAYCPVCKETLWLSEPPWKPAKGTCVRNKWSREQHSPRPMTPAQVVSYLVKSTSSSSSSSSSESDEDITDKRHGYFKSWTSRRLQIIINLPE